MCSGDLVRPERFELPTCCSGGNRSIQLSYGRKPMSSVYMRREGASISTSRNEASTHSSLGDEAQSHKRRRGQASNSSLTARTPAKWPRFASNFPRDFVLSSDLVARR